MLDQGHERRSTALHEPRRRLRRPAPRATSCVTADERLVLIHFEVATLVEDHARSALAHPASRAAADRLGVDGRPRTPLPACTSGMFAPQTTITAAASTRSRRASSPSSISEIFPVPPVASMTSVRTIAGTGRHAAGVMAGPAHARSPPGPQVRSAMRPGHPRHRHAGSRRPSSSPATSPSSFPAAVLDIAHGAPVCCTRCAATGAGPIPGVRGLVAQARARPHRRHHPASTTACTASAYVLAELGHRQDALRRGRARLTTPTESSESGLHCRAAGIGLESAALRVLTSDRTPCQLRPASSTRSPIGSAASRTCPQISGGGHPASRARCMARPVPRCCSCTPTSTPSTAALLDLARGRAAPGPAPLCPRRGRHRAGLPGLAHPALPGRGFRRHRARARAVPAPSRRPRAVRHLSPGCARSPVAPSSSSPASSPAAPA